MVSMDKKNCVQHKNVEHLENKSKKLDKKMKCEKLLNSNFLEGLNTYK